MKTVVVCSFSLLLILSSCAENSPPRDVTVIPFDVGTVTSLDVLDLEVPLFNASDEVKVYSGFSVSCGCMEVEESKITLAPHASRSLPVRLQIGRDFDTIREEIIFQDESQEFYMIKVSGEIENLVNLPQGRVYFLASDQTYEKRLPIQLSEGVKFVEVDSMFGPEAIAVGLSNTEDAIKIAINPQKLPSGQLNIPIDLKFETSQQKFFRRVFVGGIVTANVQGNTAPRLLGRFDQQNFTIYVDDFFPDEEFEYTVCFATSSRKKIEIVSRHRRLEIRTIPGSRFESMDGGSVVLKSRKYERGISIPFLLRGS